MRRVIAKSIVTLAALTSISSASAQNGIRNPDLYGYWKFETHDGISGELTLGPASCQYIVKSAFHLASALCAQIWDEDTEAFWIYGNAQASTFWTPEYQNQDSPAIDIFGHRMLLLPSFHMDHVSGGRMSGHLMGLGSNVHVTLIKH